MSSQLPKNKKRLLFVINSLGVGGAERQTIDLINNLDSRIFEIGVVYLYPKEDLLPKLNISRLKYFKYLHRRGKFDPVLFIRLAHFIKEEQFEIVICVNEYPLLYAYLSKIFHNLDFLLIAVLHHTIIHPGLWEWLKNKLYQKMLNKCKQVVFVSKNQQNYWVKKYSINKRISTFIHNGIDETTFVDVFSDNEKLNLRKNFGFQQEDFVCGICARLDPHKKHEDFIEAIHLASKILPSIKGLIIGDGPQKAILKKMIVDYSLENIIKFTGYQADVRPYISICDCMTIVSHFVETFSIAALESMAMKKPMILSNIGGASEQISDSKSGFLYNPSDTKKLCELMIRMSDQSLCKMMGEEAAQKVRSQFTLSKMVKSYESLFCNLGGRS